MTAAAHDRGSATVWVLTLAALLGVVAAAVLMLGQAAMVRQRAATAADLAALAAAARQPLDPGGACPAAARVAAAHGARLVSCRSPDGVVVDVTVAWDVTGLFPARLGGLAPVTVRSRAGPGAAP